MGKYTKETRDLPKLMHRAKKYYYYDSAAIKNNTQGKVFLFKYGQGEKCDGGYIEHTDGNWHDTGTPLATRATTTPTGTKTEEQSNWISANGVISEDIEMVLNKLYLGIPIGVTDTLIRCVWREDAYVVVELNDNIIYESPLSMITPGWGLSSPSISAIGVPSRNVAGIDFRDVAMRDRFLKHNDKFLITIDFKNPVSGKDNAAAYTVSELVTSKINHLRIFGMIEVLRKKAVKDR